MRLKFFSHLLVMVLLNLLVKPLAIFAIDATVQNRVGSAEYGFYFALLNFTYLFNILLDFGITNYNTKKIAQHPERAKTNFGKIIPLRLTLWLAYALFTLGLTFAFRYNKRQFEVVGLLIVNQFLISITLFFRSYFAGLLMLKTEVLFSVLDKLLLVLIGAVWLFAQHSVEVNIINFVWLQMLTAGITAIFALLLVLRKTGLPTLKWDFPFQRKIILQSLPYATLIVFMMLYHRIDSVLLERLLSDGENQTGIYAQAYRIVDALFMFASLFSSLLFPIFARMLKKKEPVFPLFDSASRVLISGALVLAIMVFFQSKFILQLVYFQDIHASSQAFTFLMLSFVPMCIIVLCGTLLTANGNLKFLNLASLCGIIVNVGINLILIPKYGAWGAAVTMLITQSIVAAMQLFYVVRVFKLSFRVKGVLRYIGLLAVLLFSGFDWGFGINPIVHLSLIGVFALVYCLLTNMLQWRLLLSLLKR